MPLTLIVFAFIPIMFIFALFMRKRMRNAFKKNRESIADINAQIEDNLSGIRVVKSFANESVEMDKFALGNQKFVESKRNSYKAMGAFHSGLTLFSALINVAVIGGGGLFIAYDIINVGDLLTFLLYVNTLIEPVRKLINFTEQYQNGMSGFNRFYEIFVSLI